MRQKRGLDADKKGPLCEGAPAKRVEGERACDLAVVNSFVSPSVACGDSAPPLALRATSPVSGEAVSQRAAFVWDKKRHRGVRWR